MHWMRTTTGCSIADAKPSLTKQNAEDANSKKYAGQEKLQNDNSPLPSCKKTKVDIAFSRQQKWKTQLNNSTNSGYKRLFQTSTKETKVFLLTMFQ